MRSYHEFEALDLARRRLEEAERNRLVAEFARARATTRGPHLLRRLGARLAASVSRLSADLARLLDERALEAPWRRDAVS